MFNDDDALSLFVIPCTQRPHVRHSRLMCTHVYVCTLWMCVRISSPRLLYFGCRFCSFRRVLLLLSVSTSNYFVQTLLFFFPSFVYEQTLFYCVLDEDEGKYCKHSHIFSFIFSIIFIHRRIVLLYSLFHIRSMSAILPVLLFIDCSSGNRFLVNIILFRSELALSTGLSLDGSPSSFNTVFYRFCALVFVSVCFRSFMDFQFMFSLLSLFPTHSLLFPPTTVSFLLPPSLSPLLNPFFLSFLPFSSSLRFLSISSSFSHFLTPSPQSLSFSLHPLYFASVYSLFTLSRLPSLPPSLFSAFLSYSLFPSSFPPSLIPGRFVKH